MDYPSHGLAFVNNVVSKGIYISTEFIGAFENFVALWRQTRFSATQLAM